MEKFTTLTGIAAPMPLVNIDTDMIIPKQFLKTIKRSGLGVNLFDEMRYNLDGSEIADFVLNQPAYRKAQIIIAGDNFGCGSSPVSYTHLDVYKRQRQGIVHIVGPEQGWTLPGMTVVCGDSHTATHGAFGALAHGIGTSEVEHVLATQTLIQRKGKNMKVEITGSLRPGVTAKDITMAVIGETGTAGGTGYVIEYCGQAIRELSMDCLLYTSRCV